MLKVNWVILPLEIVHVDYCELVTLYFVFSTSVSHSYNCMKTFISFCCNLEENKVCKKNVSYVYFQQFFSITEPSDECFDHRLSLKLRS